MKLIFSHEAINSERFCETSLSKLADDSLTSDHSGNESHLGLFHELEELLIAAKLPETERRIVLADAIRVLKYEGENGALAETVSEVKNAFSRLDPFVCVAGDQCKLHDPEATALHCGALRGIRTGALPMVKANSDGTALAEALYSLIVVEHPSFDSSREGTAWLANLFHEGSHYATQRKIVSWVNANEAILARDKPGDAFFDRFVGRDEKGIVIDRAFYDLVLESRGYATSAAVAYLVSEPNVFDMATDIRATATRCLRNQPVSNLGVEAWIPPEIEMHNVFSTGDRFIERMNETIRESELFPK